MGSTLERKNSILASKLFAVSVDSILKGKTRNMEIPQKTGFPTAAWIKNMDQGR